MDKAALTEQAKEYFKKHKAALEKWEHGDLKDAWIDQDENLCIQYQDGCWWHYRYNSAGELGWW